MTDKWSEEWGGESFWSFGTAHGQGVGILFRPNLEVKILKKLTDKDGRLILLVIHHRDYELNLICVYAPTRITIKSFFRNSQNVRGLNTI